MTDTDQRHHLRALLDRLARVASTEDWQADLNPAQGSALAYLGRANRFSRAPSQVADYLGTTRGTVSQTLKALQRKGLIRDTPDGADRRRIAYAVTSEGRALLERPRVADRVMAELGEADAAALERGVTALLHAMLKARDGRSFGICRSCRHHRDDGHGRHCALLDVALTPDEAGQICHEHEAA